MNSSSNESLSDILDRLNKEQAIIMIPSTILVIITMLVGIIGNTLTCYVYGFRLKMTPTYLFVVMLALMDLINSVIITPGRIVQNVVPLKTTWDGMCKNHMVLSVFTGLATCGFLMAIAIDRYRKLCCPLKTQISMFGAKVITLIICIFCAIQGGIVTLYYGSVRKPTTISNVFGYSCSAKITKKVNYYQLGFFAFYLLVTIFTIISLTIMYSIVLHTMKKIVNKNKTVVATPPSKAENLRRRLSNVVLQFKVKADPSSTSSNNSTTLTNCSSNNTIDEIVTDIEENISSTSSVEPTSSSSGVSSSSSGAPPPVRESKSSPVRKNKGLTKNETRTQSLKRAEENLKRLNRTTITMMMITLVFIITFIPSISAMMVNAAVKAEQKMGTAAAVFYWLARHTFYISSCLNPVIYGYRNPNFMDEVKLLFKKFK